MAIFLGTTEIRELAGRVGIESLLSGIADTIGADFLRWAAFDKCARLASHSAGGVIELMPISDGQWYAFKFVNGHPGNHALGLPTVMAFSALAEVATGEPLLLAEASVTTALRTAATSALAARVLARPDARSMALIGNGAQAEFQALAFARLLGVREVRAFDVDPAATQKLAANLRPWPQIQVVRARSVAEAVAGADIVTTITADKSRAHVIDDAMIAPGVHLNAVGGDCPGKTEIDPALLARARVVVEYEPQTRIEGEIQQLAPDFPVTELWRILAGHVPGRRDAAEVTLFDSVGFALEDFSALRYLRDIALGQAIGRPLELVALPADPKDLFGTIAPIARATPRQWLSVG